ncbi:MAG TPA: GNAT family protein [Candidatus Dormibacteraeota bacterium]|jgi:RimJ/RimL family protein N-acetyltransferase|nr:GNAT family protein [Candidatus Dormibacteraeota bacterium]HEX2681912.1 GNAT family protein [Candidatus Dormibacteraeota bacterium]
MYGPVIQGKLVRLRPPRAEDAPTMIAWFEDLEVTHFLELRYPPTLEAEKEWIEQMGRDANAVIWVVEHEGRAVGSTGIRDINWRDGHGRTGTIIGDKQVWGKGLGRELMQLRANYAFNQLPLRKLKSAYLDGNEASERAQKSVGYREVGRWHKDHFIDGKWVDHVMTELLREDWEKAHGGG